MGCLSRSPTRTSSSPPARRPSIVAGQVAEDADGNLVGPGDLAGQARQAFANLGLVLAAAGARPDQVARITIYVVGHRPELMDEVGRRGSPCSATTCRPTPAWAWRRWPKPGRLIEVEAIAVLD